MNIKERLKKIRNNQHLTQQEFADRLGIKRNTVATYETGKSNPSDSAIVLICREFNIREEWLRTGEGEMYRPKPSDALDRLAYENNFSNADYVVIEKIISLQPEQRKHLFEQMFNFLHEVEAALSGTDPFAPAYNESETPHPMDDILANISALSNEELGQHIRSHLEAEEKVEEKSRA